MPDSCNWSLEQPCLQYRLFVGEPDTPRRIGACSEQQDPENDEVMSDDTDYFLVCDKITLRLEDEGSLSLTRSRSLPATGLEHTKAVVSLSSHNCKKHSVQRCCYKSWQGEGKGLGCIVCYESCGWCNAA